MQTRHSIETQIKILETKLKTLPEFVTDLSKQKVKLNPKRFAVAGKIKSLKDKLQMIKHKEYLAM